ncbi:MAG: 2-oxoacid:ferredoxin oxidoreductase subunit beta [Nitrososphaera sp.]
MALKLADYKTEVHNDWCPGCVLPDTTIHCNPSAKQIQEVSVGERVLGRDGRFHKVTEIISHIHRGKMFRIVTKCFGETFATPEHPILVVKRSDRNKKLHNTSYDAVWKRADEIEEKDYLIYPIQKEQEDRDYIDVDYRLPKKDTVSKEMPARMPLDAGFLRLMGYYIAEGYAHNREISFTFHVDEVEFLEDVKETMMRVFGLEGTTRTKGKGITITFYSAPLARLFSEWFGEGAYNKKIPHFAMLLPVSKQAELIKGLWRGDGWVSPGQRRANFKTISKTLCEQVKTLLLRQWIVPVISVMKASGIHRKSYSVQVVSDRDFAVLCRMLGRDYEPIQHTGKPPSSILGPDYVLIPIKKIDSFDYEGPVFNLEVNDVNSYVSENAVLHNCGDFGILNAIQMALADMQIPPYKATIFSGIGCSGKTPHFIKTYGIHTLHGRVLPFAQGAKLANPDLQIIAVGGDGDGLGIGAGHFVGAGRRNVDMTYIIFNNAVYGLTKGQASPTLKLGMKTKSLPQPNMNNSVNPIALALVSGFTFIARGYSYDVRHLKDVVRKAVEHKGLAFVDVLQPCPTYNDINTKEWFQGADLMDPNTKRAMPRIYKMEEQGYDGIVRDPSEMNAKMAKVIEKSNEWGDRIPIGVFYQNEHIPTYQERISARIENYREEPPAKQQIADSNGKTVTNIERLLNDLRVDK